MNSMAKLTNCAEFTNFFASLLKLPRRPIGPGAVHTL